MSSQRLYLSACLSLLFLTAHAQLTTRDNSSTILPDTAIQLSTGIRTVKGAMPVYQTSSTSMSKQQTGSYPPASKSASGTPALGPLDPIGPVNPADPADAGNPGNSLRQSGSSEAGRTPSTLDVSGSGGAVFNVPIALPPGIGSAVPQLALSYNSQADNGIAGYGWNLSGLSAITRLPTTLFHDGQISGVNYDANDRFTLDGQRLLLKSGTYGTDGTEYQTEGYSNTRIISRGVSPYGASYGPEYFEVLFPDGSKAYYGQNANSRTPTDYAITYTVNTNGARINYYYQQSNNVLLISSIHYGSVNSTSGINQVNFLYSYSSRPEQVFVGGQSFYRDQKLSKISVTANGVPYRHYVLTHNTMQTLNYPRLASIQEFDGAEAKSLEPIYFTYSTTGDVITTSTISSLSVSGIASNNSQVVTGDFTGNGAMDFLLYPNTKNKFWAFYDVDAGSPQIQLGYEFNTGPFLKIFPTTWLTYNDKIPSGQGMTLVKHNGYNSLKFSMYSTIPSAPVYYQYEKAWNNIPLGIGYYSECDNQHHEGNPLDNEFISGDFNGDGLTDIITVAKSWNTVVYEYLDNTNPGGPGNPGTTDAPEGPEHSTTTDATGYGGNCIQQYGESGSPVYFVNMDRRKTTDFVNMIGNFYPYYLTGEHLYTGDLNGDGKTDILHIKNGMMIVYTLSNNSLQRLWQTSDSRIALNNPILTGDYNGDGKMDIMFSTGNNALFATFISTGNNFVKHEQNQPFSNTAGSWDGRPGVEKLDLYYLISNDMNGDGKTDIISAHTTTYNNSPFATINTTIYHNTGINASAQPIFGSSFSNVRYEIMRHYPIPIFLNPEKPNHKLEFGFMSDNKVTLFKFQKDLKTESQLTGISQDGVSQHITYRTLSSDNTYPDEIPLYQVSYSQTYPYIDLYNIPGMNVVSKLTRTYGGEQVSQIFGYGKAVSHALGLGFLGFGELIRSNWYTNSSDVNRMFNISIQDPLLRGANVRSFTSRSSYINPAIKDMALTNPNPSGATADGASLNDYVTRTDQVYNTQLLPSKVWLNIPVATVTKDMLGGSFGVQTMEYDSYYNITKSVANMNGNGTKTITSTFENNPGGYYIGRPLNTQTVMNNGNDTYSSEESYSYTGYLPTQIIKKGNNTGATTENVTYDGLGNITQKTIIVPGGVQRTVTMQYDPTGRFVVRDTDAEGMANTYQYNPSLGTIQSKTNPYGQQDSYTYDSWGRQISATNYLNISSYRSYQKSESNTIITETDDEGRYKMTLVNALGQNIETREKNVLGQIVGKAWQFDPYGRQSAESQPAVPGSYNQWSTTAYDEYGRVKQTVSYTGQTTNFSYNNLSTTVSDGIKSTTTTKNGLGNVISLQDAGGVINYTYFANGNIKSANYGGIVQSIEQDGWGHKTKLTDPSAGTYQYEYDGFGQVTKETSPKGVTTYSYDNNGLLLEKKLTGDGTGMLCTYTYDNTTKLLTNMNLSNDDGNNAVYSYVYDGQKRLVSSTEDNLHAKFARHYTYDSYGRVNTESHEAKNKQNNITVQKTIEFQYQNGQVLQTIMQGTGQVIWRVNSLTNTGKLNTALQGANLKYTYQYDQYGLPQQRKLENVAGSPITLMELGYTFNAQRGLITSRSNSAFNWNEQFSYDHLDRLTEFNDNNGNNNQTYDSRGRIINSSLLGDYEYGNNSYRQIALNNMPAAANAWYQASSLQEISYNAFKSPIEIKEPGRERISFQYNGSLSRSHMYFGNEQDDKMLRRYRRHYAEDGGVEITNDLQNGTTSFVFYLGGDAYSAPAIWKEVHGGGTTTSGLYYLHRDHLSSIVMITNEQGNVVEKRQFDAWGNIVKLTDGNGVPLTTFAILDRGFTGHEHLLGVGLINMNGRLYDPKLHRFLSPDNYVQDMFNTQNYNRYGYVMNNPLTYVDASGEFFWLAIAAGAIIGALSGGASYVAQAIKTGDWSWGQLGKSMLMGAVVGGITGGVNPMSLISTSFWGTIGSSFVVGLLPSVNFAIGNWHFSLSPSIAFGKSFGMGANVSVGYASDGWNFSVGAGYMAYGDYQGFGKGGEEIRTSIQAGYDDGKGGFSVGTNWWSGSGEMGEFNQRTGAIGVRFSKDLKMLYENDGGFLIKELRLGDRGDSYRSAALVLTYKDDFSVGINLFTGRRSREDQAYEDEYMKVLDETSKKKDKKIFPIQNITDEYGAKFTRGYVHETGHPYRLGLLTFGYKDFRVGTNSEHIRHAIQNRVIHGIIKDAGFRNMSWNWAGYSQYKTRNIYSTW